MIRHQNPDPMVQAMVPASASWRQHFDDELRLRQNHRQNQEIGLLYIVSILWLSVLTCCAVHRLVGFMCSI
jgi:hypothetical protein